MSSADGLERGQKPSRRAAEAGFARGGVKAPERLAASKRDSAEIGTFASCFSWEKRI